MWENTPAVLTVGRRCLEQGFSFDWMAGKHPHFSTPSGKIVELEVIDDIPYLRAGSKSCAPKKPTTRTRVPGFPVEVADADVGGSGAAGDADNVVEEAPPEGGADPMIDLEEVVLRDVRAEAMSPEHLTTHKPKNPFGHVRLRAKTKKLKSFRGAFDR